MKKLYELSVRLGELVCSGVGDTVEEALQHTALHLKSFVKSVNIYLWYTYDNHQGIFALFLGLIYQYI